MKHAPAFSKIPGCGSKVEQVVLKVVIIIKWSMLTGGRVKGLTEIYNLNQAGNSNLVQNEVIFYLPNIARYEYIKLVVKNR